jgi:acetyl-CoA carboxylase carboxyltransferase component
MSWTPEIEQLERLRRLRKRMGGAESIARQHAQGRLTVRERVDLLVDANSFQETSTSAGAAKWDAEGRLVSFRPMAYVTGQANIDGRPVILEGGDFTVAAPRTRGPRIRGWR